MNFNKVPVTQCPKCGHEANTAIALSCAVCAHPLRGNHPVKARQAFIGKGALSSKSLRLDKNSPTRKSSPIEKKPAPFLWIALVLPPLLIGAGYLIGRNSAPSKTYDSSSLNRIPPNSIPAPVKNVPAPSSKPAVNQSPRINQTQRAEIPAKDPLKKPPILVSTKASKPSGKSVVTLQKRTETPLLLSPRKPLESPVKEKSKIKPTELTVNPPSQTSQIVESQEPTPMGDTPSAVVIDSSEANAGTPSMDCYSGQAKLGYACRNRKN